MSQYNDQYYIIFEKYNEDTLYLAVHDRSDYRNYEYTKLTFGQPMFFENGYREEDLARGIRRPIKNAHLDATWPVVSKEIKESLEHTENATFQFYPAVIVDDEGNYHEEYWVFNIFEQMDVLDLEKCEIDDFDPNNEVHPIDKYYLSDDKLAAIPESERLVFQPDFGNVAYTMVHKSVVDIFKKHNVDTLNFIKVSEWEMGLQFVEEE